MKHFFSLAVAMAATCTCLSQSLDTPAPGGNKKALVGEVIGITQVTIHYDRPGVKGREGKIYGTGVVHKGFENPGFGTSKAAPWRAGANENTTIEFSTDVKIEGEPLAAGKYGFFIAYDDTECTLIFSKNNTSWGHFFYDDKEDALRVKVKPAMLEKSVEWLKYEFVDQTENSATIALQWEKRAIAFRVEVNLFETLLANYRLALRSSKGFTWEANNQAAALCLQYNANLAEGLSWSETSLQYDRNFTNLSTNARLHEKLGHATKADSVMKAALALGKVFEIHFYGRQLIGEKKPKAALEVFKFNAKKFPGQYTTYVGMARGLSANGDYKNALVNAKQALPLAPDEVNKKSVENIIKKLEAGQDIN